MIDLLATTQDTFKSIARSVPALFNGPLYTTLMIVLAFILIVVLAYNGTNISLIKVAFWSLIVVGTVITVYEFNIIAREHKNREQTAMARFTTPGITSQFDTDEKKGADEKKRADEKKGAGEDDKEEPRSMAQKLFSSSTKNEIRIPKFRSLKTGKFTPDDEF